MVLNKTGMQGVYQKSAADMEGDYKRYFQLRARKENLESNKKRRENDDDQSEEEEVIDPDCARFLENLKEDVKSYIYVCEEDGVPVKIKYEGESSLDEECDVEPVRKLRRSATKVINAPSHQHKGKKQQANNKGDNAKSSDGDPDYGQWLNCTKFLKDKTVTTFGDLTITYYEVRKNNVVGKKKENGGSFPGVEIIDHETFYKGGTEDNHGSSYEDEGKISKAKKQANKVKSKKEDKAKSSKKEDKAKSSNKLNDPDYDRWLKCTKFSKDKMVTMFGELNVTYGELRKNNVVQEKENDGSFPGVKIIDADTFYKEITAATEDNDERECSDGSSSKDEGPDFRQKVLNDLRKPYNKKEHEMLLQEIELRRQEDRHLDLRKGRERSCSTTKLGKSYLDHYPVLRRKLAQVQHDKQKCLNLLRGFFLYLQQSEPPFRPWEDEECCGITPNTNADRQKLPGIIS